MCTCGAFVELNFDIDSVFGAMPNKHFYPTPLEMSLEMDQCNPVWLSVWWLGCFLTRFSSIIVCLFQEQHVVAAPVFYVFTIFHTQPINRSELCTNLPVYRKACVLHVRLCCSRCWRNVEMHVGRSHCCYHKCDSVIPKRECNKVWVSSMRTLTNGMYVVTIS